MCIASGALTTISGGVQPASWMSALEPEMMPPSGTLTTCVTPLTRVTGTSSLCGLIATSARAFGLKSPSSVVSTVPATESISTRPTLDPESIRPGYTERPVPSMTVALAGTLTFAPTAVMTPFAKTIVPLGIGAEVTG
jgi:hypothetical protein